MSLYMYDAAYAPSLATCKARGAIAMSHYMTRSFASTSPQSAATRSAGMGAVQNWEGLANELVGASESKGESIGREVLGAIPAGMPLNGSIGVYHSVDVAIYGAPYSDCDAAFAGLNNVLDGKVKVKTYAELAVIEHLLSKGLVQGKQWLSMSESFPGFHGPWTHVAMVQMHDAAGQWIGTDVPNTDRNTVLDPYALDAWWPTGSPYLGGDDVSQADVIAALQSAAGKEAVRAAIWDSPMLDPSDPLGKRTYKAKQYLVSTYVRSLGIKGVASQITDLALGIDVNATATAIKDRFLAILGGTPGGTA